MSGHLACALFLFSLQAVALVGRECFELAALLSVQQMQHHQEQTEGGSPADVFDETIEGEDDFERHMMMLLPYYTDYADVSICLATHLSLMYQLSLQICIANPDVSAVAIKIDLPLLLLLLQLALPLPAVCV